MDRFVGIYFFHLFLFSSLFLSTFSRAGVCSQKGLKPYLELFMNLDFSSHRTSSSLKNEESFLRALGVENPDATDLQHASRLFRWTRREERFGERSKEIQERQLETLKRILEKKYLIKKKDIPESFFKAQVRRVRERGGDITEIQSGSGRDRLTETLLGDQRSSLHAWVDYLALDDATERFPTWVKLWVMEGILKLGRYDLESRSFGKRSKKQTAPFAELNREALAMVMGDILKKMDLLKLKSKGEVKKEGLKEKLKTLGVSNQSDSYLDALLSGSFKKIYEETLILVNQERGDLSLTKGKWIHYPQGSDPKKLTKVLDGQGTGWCTAHIGTAKDQLSRGDFYVYFSNDFDGNPTIPRIAIRMEEDEIAEIRGRASDQNLDPEMAGTGILKEKLKEFGEDGEKYEVRLAHSRRLSDLEMKMEQNLTLTKDDLRFLHEIDEKIESFGYEEDPRIQEIIEQRDKRADIASIFGYEPHEISFSEKEALGGGIKFHYGDLHLRRIKDPHGLQLPERVSGYLDLYGLESAEGLKLPSYIGGDLYFENLTSAKGLKFPNYVGGDLDLRSLESAEGLNLPNHIGGDLDLNGFTSAERLKLPDHVGGSLDLSGLTLAEGLKLPDYIGGDLNLMSLISAKGLKFPAQIGGSLHLSDLTSTRELKLPNKIGGSLDLLSLTSTDGLKLPDYIGRDLNLNSLTSAKGLKLPDFIGGDLNLSGLTSAKGLKFPDQIGGYLHLSGLTSAEGLKLPYQIEGALDLRSLTSAEELKLPDQFEGHLYLNSLTSLESLDFPKHIKGPVLLDNRFRYHSELDKWKSLGIRFHFSSN